MNVEQVSVGPCWPEFGRIWRRISRESKVAFLSAMLMGIIVHLYAFSNLLITHDGLSRIRIDNDGLTSGRWALRFFSSFSWIYETPVVIGILTIFALAMSSVLVTHILELSNCISIVLVSGVLVSFPAVSAIFLFLFTTDAFFFAVLLNIFGVFIAKKYRFGWIAAIFCIATACGVYQAYIGCTVVLFLFDCILMLFSEKGVPLIIKQGIKYLLIIFISLVVYKMILNGLLTLRHATLINYKGMSDAMNSSITDMLQTLPGIYKDFFVYLWKPHYFTPKFTLIQRFLFVLAFICFLTLIIAKRIYKEPIRLLLMFIGIILIPPAVSLICIIGAGNIQPYELMRYPIVLIYAFIIKIFEICIQHFLPSVKKYWRYPVLAGWLLCGALIWINFCITNTGYLRWQFEIENSISLANRIAARIESMDEYTPDITVVLVGTASKNYSRTFRFPQVDFLVTDETCDLVLAPYLFRIMQYWGGFHMQRPNGEQRADVLGSGILETMPSYPSKDSIQYYNEMIIVKLSDANYTN